MEKTDIKVTVYRDGDFMIYIEESIDDYTIRLGHTHYAPIEYLGKKPKGQASFEELLSIVERNLEEHEKNYRLKYFDYEDMSDKEQEIFDMVDRAIEDMIQSAHIHDHDEPSPFTS